MAAVIVTFLQQGAGQDLGELAKIYADNGWRDDVWVSAESSFEAIKVARAFSLEGIPVAANKSAMQNDARRLMLTRDMNAFRLVVKSAVKGKRQRTVVALMNRTYKTEVLEDVIRMESTGTSSYFYTIVWNGNRWILFSTISTPRFKSPVVSSVKFSPKSFILNETYNLQGNPVLDITLDFMPYVYSEKCAPDKIRVDCDLVGLMIDYLDAIATLHNFTAVNRRQKDLLWGTLMPKNGSFVGTMGAVVKGEADVSLSVWRWDAERDRIMDLVPVLFEPQLLVMTPKQPDVDLAMLLRPFTGRTW